MSARRIDLEKPMTKLLSPKLDLVFKLLFVGNPDLGLQAGESADRVATLTGLSRDTVDALQRQLKGSG